MILEKGNIWDLNGLLDKYEEQNKCKKSVYNNRKIVSKSLEYFDKLN